MKHNTLRFFIAAFVAFLGISENGFATDHSTPPGGKPLGLDQSTPPQKSSEGKEKYQKFLEDSLQPLTGSVTMPTGSSSDDKAWKGNAFGKNSNAQAPASGAAASVNNSTGSAAQIPPALPPTAASTASKSNIKSAVTINPELQWIAKMRPYSEYLKPSPTQFAISYIRKEAPKLEYYKAVHDVLESMTEDDFKILDAKPLDVIYQELIDLHSSQGQEDQLPTVCEVLRSLADDLLSKSPQDPQLTQKKKEFFQKSFNAYRKLHAVEKISKGKKRQMNFSHLDALTNILSNTFDRWVSQQGRDKLYTIAYPARFNVPANN